jgi:hypothetical protein
MASVNDEAGEELRSSHLYVHPAALDELEERGIGFDPSAQAAVRRELADASVATFIAVLPIAAQGTRAVDLRQETGESGTYLLALPDSRFEAWSDELPQADVQQAAREASGGTPESFFIGFVSRVDDLAAGEAAAGDGASSDGDGSGYVPLAILLAAGGGGLLLYRRNKRQRELAQLNQVRGALEEDITAYGEEVASLDLDPRNRAIPTEARDEYSSALDLYETAKSAAARAESPGHLRPVTAALEQGRWLLSCVRARLNGEGVPERRPPCFFDPRHGPSVADVEWTPPGGVPREVPACQADVIRLREGEEPDSRLVTVDGERRPYWEAGPAYSAWAAGYYGAFLPAMLWGTMLGSAMAHGPAYADAGSYDSGGFDSGGYDSGGFDSGGYDSGGFDGGGFDAGGFGGFDF